MNEIQLILYIYRKLIGLRKNGIIPVKLRPASVVGTVQDDPFDCWIEEVIKFASNNNIQVYHSGSLTTPDLIIRDKNTGTIIGIEVKKLIQKANGKDPRGMTLDYNSCLPCGKCFVKVEDETLIVPCFYLFALLNPKSTEIVSLILLDGDFLNYDFELYKDAKYANTSEYNHGPYAEGSVRHRRMYTYPNPLNSRLEEFYLRMILILKKQDTIKIPSANKYTEQIVRSDKYGNSFYYYLLDETGVSKSNGNKLAILKDIFDACKQREEKERVAYIPIIPRF